MGKARLRDMEKMLFPRRTYHVLQYKAKNFPILFMPLRSHSSLKIQGRSDRLYVGQGIN